MDREQDRRLRDARVKIQNAKRALGSDFAREQDLQRLKRRHQLNELWDTLITAEQRGDRHAIEHALAVVEGYFEPRQD
jgi:hypothetical protein